jgi:hypothetical protein
VARAAFLVVGLLFTAFVLFWGTVAVTNAVGHVTETQSLTFGGPGQIKAIVVRTGAGTIDVRGSERSDVSGVRTVEHGWQTPELTEQVDGGTLTLDARCDFVAVAWCRVSYTLDVPHDTQVDIQSGAGTASVSSIDASVEAHSGAGSVNVDDCHGAVDIETGAGSAKATRLTSDTVTAHSGAGSTDLQFDQAPRQVDARSGAGSVDIQVPRDDTAYSISGTSGHGSRHIDVNTAPGSDHTMNLESGAGSISVHYP